MKTQIRKYNHKKRNVIIAVIGAVFVVLLFATLYIHHNQSNILGWYPFGAPKNGSINYGPATNEEVNAGTNTKSDTVNGSDNSDSSNTTKPGNEQTTPATGEGVDKSTVGLRITHKNQDTTNLNIGTLILALTSTGTCTLTLSKPGSTDIVQTSGTQASSSSSTCTGFRVPLSQMVAGTWTINLSFSDTNNKGAVVTTVDIVK